MVSADDERWREALRQYEARRERIRRLRAELAQARAAGLAARHARRMARKDNTNDQRGRSE